MPSPQFYLAMPSAINKVAERLPFDTIHPETICLNIDNLPNKLLRLEATPVQNSGHSPTKSQGVKCRATSVAKNHVHLLGFLPFLTMFYISISDSKYVPVKITFNAKSGMMMIEL